MTTCNHKTAIHTNEKKQKKQTDQLPTVHSPELEESSQYSQIARNESPAHQATSTGISAQAQATRQISILSQTESRHFTCLLGLSNIA
tara:strand:+ start:112 stop:375 length:264 start_codon:yes stop_codon:yes gene_type:complete